MSTADILQFFRNTAAFAENLPDGAAETWLAALTQIAEPLASSSAETSLRPAQLEAWRGLASRRVGLVLGPPGTGKTFVLSWMALAYAEARRRAGMPCRILVTGFTRNAIANLLDGVAEKAARYGISVPILFIGTPPESGLPRNVGGVRDAQDARADLSNEHIVCGSTVWTLHKMLSGSSLPGASGPTAQVFDLICIDEASQLLLTQGLMSLAGLAAGGRVLVSGDNRQLPPVQGVHEHEIEGRPLGVSLYDFLVSQGVSEFPLDETFRLNAPLTAFPEQEFYPGRYRSADSVAERRLALRSDWEAGLDVFQQFALDPNFPVVVVLHDGPPCGTSNAFEVLLVSKLARIFYDRCTPEDQVPSVFWQNRLAVISPHRAQNTAIRDALGGRGIGDNCVVETVDRIQGRERDCVIACYTVSDPEFALAEASFIFSRERLNVTTTRARSKLILVVSRRLLEAIPPDEDDFDAAQVLREFVFSTAEAGTFEFEDGDGRQVPVALRLRGFSGGPPVPTLGEVVPTTGTIDLPEWTPALNAVLQAVRKVAGSNKFHTATLKDVEKQLYRKVLFEEFRDLFRLGWIDLRERRGPYGEFWTASPLDEQRAVLPATVDGVRTRIEEVLHSVRRSRLSPFYDNVRARFDWIAPDQTDAMLPVVEKLVEEGVLRVDQVNGRRTLELANVADPVSEPVAPPTEALMDVDFQLLNRLEQIEAKRINFGVFESWSLPSDLVADAEHVDQDALRRLEAHGFIMRTDDGRIRSRMAELAREVRYSKQRFAPGDADRRPYLVRGLKVRTVERHKPRPDTAFSDIERTLLDRLATRSAAEVIRSLGVMLQREWRVSDPLLRGFQARALTSILPAWLGQTADDTFVITADTGSGKTEAACLPMIAGAAIDSLGGVQGTRAILVYPRVRLAANQAQRLARYLAALDDVDGFPSLTLGVQTGIIPQRFDGPLREDLSELWKRHDVGWTFPLFDCPRCDRPIHMQVGAGVNGADRLDCSACAWHFDGWIGSKDGLRRRPPTLFIPVTESLHQWMQDSRYGALWGDSQPWVAPRAVLADEIHLYTHVHGAQVGFALRRLLHRLQTNSSAPPLAIGMSATLGDPARTWCDLVGRERAESIAVNPPERDENPRGREYYYFVQPEVESRGKDIAGASTTIQSLMCLSHGMRRRTGAEGGYRALVFLDSIDKLRRLHSDFMDAEEGKRLAQLRTHLYGGPGGGQVGCCRSPELCSTFRSGECWYFAATDDAQWTASGRYDVRRHLTVSDTPVYSGNRSNVEQMIRRSDVVFSTSSLEVGYDDPDIMLVYQHYSPVNIASFVQRKGRGGRGADDRPITGITLSVYSPRDSWFFRRPDQLLNASGFQVPLNMNNFFVRRGQAIAAALDALALYRAQRGAVDPTSLSSDARNEVNRYLAGLFDPALFQELGAANASAFLEASCLAVTRPPIANAEPKEWMSSISFAPRTLFTSVNMPLLEVGLDASAAKTEDIALALSECAPGNITRRFDPRIGHWLLPTNGRAPLLSPNALATSSRFSVDDGRVEDHLPDDVRTMLGDVAQDVVRPTRLDVVSAGRFSGADWMSDWKYDTQHRRVVPKTQAPPTAPEVQSKTRGILLGHTSVEAAVEHGQALACDIVEPLVRSAQAFEGRPGRSGTGLIAYRLYWGADADLRLSDGDDASLSQRFVHPDSPQRTQLYGYRLMTEGVRIQLDSELLDSFVATELERIRGTDEERGLNAQHFRFLIEARAQRIGIGSFEARRLAELLTAAATGTLREQFSRLRSLWDTEGFVSLLQRAFAECLAFHPLLSQRRVDALSESLRGSSGLREFIFDALRDVASEQMRGHFVRTLALHGTAVRLKQLFVLIGRGDERRVLLHARLPVQFSERPSDVITLFEHGEHGDGTTRLFHQHASEAFRELRNGFLADCPNAREDEVVNALLSRPDRHSNWRTWDPRSEVQMQRIAAELGARNDDSLQSALRILFGVETVGARRFPLLDLSGEVTVLRTALESSLRRQSMPWELVTHVVRSTVATADNDLPVLRGLLQAYRDLPDASGDERLSPEARLAEQVYRIAVPLCRDGCRACVQTGSDVMSDSLAEATVSRSALVRLSALVGWN